MTDPSQLVVEITPVSIDNIGYKTYIYFAIVSVLRYRRDAFQKTRLLTSTSSTFASYPSYISVGATERVKCYRKQLTLCALVYPETQRLSLEQIDKLFTGEKVLLHWHPSMDDGEMEMDHTEALKEDQVDRIEGLARAGPSKL